MSDACPFLYSSSIFYDILHMLVAMQMTHAPIWAANTVDSGPHLPGSAPQYAAFRISIMKEDQAKCRSAPFPSQLTHGIIATSSSSLSYSLCGSYQFCLSKPWGGGGRGGGPGAVSSKTILTLGFLTYSYSMMPHIYTREWVRSICPPNYSFIIPHHFRCFPSTLYTF